MRDEHEHLAVGYRWVDFEVASNTFMQNNVPIIDVALFFRCVEVDLIAPGMTYTTDFELKFIKFCSFIDVAWINNKFQVESIKISLDVNALIIPVVPIID